MKINDLSTVYSALSEQKVVSPTSGEDFQKVLENAAKQKDIDGLKKACQEFETFFVEKIFKQMRSSIGEVEKSQAQSTYEGMLDTEMAKEITKAEGIGLANSMFETMKKAYLLDAENEATEKEETQQGFDISG